MEEEAPASLCLGPGGVFQGMATPFDIRGGALRRPRTGVFITGRGLAGSERLGLPGLESAAPDLSAGGGGVLLPSGKLGALRFLDAFAELEKVFGAEGVFWFFGLATTPTPCKPVRLDPLSCGPPTTTMPSESG